MCGIAGIYGNQSKDQGKLLRVIKKINHRGPDSNGFWSDNILSLASVRLKVVDLNEKSNQPFISQNKKFVIAFNGEIYNYKDLKRKFNIKTFTNSDTEVIVELFSKIGPETFSLLDGMFAISIYDIKNKKLYIARDIFGIKPLYYLFRKDKFIFSSEIKGILEIEKNITYNNQSVFEFIRWGGLDHSTKTFFKNINSIEPATYSILDKNYNLQKVKYYKLENNLKENLLKKKDIPFIFNELLKKSIKNQSNTVRSLGTHLSGGVDSSLVTAYLKEINPLITTYTFGYNEKEYDERFYAKKVSEKLNLKNFTSLTSTRDINDNFINTLIMQDEPFTSFRQVSHHKLYEDYKKEGATVIIESSGGDEIGAGYTGFLWPYFIDEANEIGFSKAIDNLYKNLKLNKLDNNFINNFINNGNENQKFYGISTSDGQKFTDKFFLKDSFLKNFDDTPPSYFKPFNSNLLNAQYIELFHTKLPRGLRYVDRASSSSGREARVPLLNKEIVEFCFSIPNEFKIKNGQLRWFMKKSLDYLKEKKINLYSNKRSIADPQRIWIKRDLKKIFFEVFNSKSFKNREIFNYKKVLEHYNNFLKKKNAHSLGIFQIFITEIWFRIFFDNAKYNFQGQKLDQFIRDTNN